jgi:hypothetical protein
VLLFLGGISDNLAISAQGFRRGANKVRKQMWWKDMKMRLLIIAGIVILIVIIVGECTRSATRVISRDSPGLM